MITVYTDGSCSGNPGPGGFGVIVCEHNFGAPVEDYNIIDAYQSTAPDTTNNREEMKAIIWAIENYGINEPTICSDSAYCVNTFTKWMYGWKDNGWRRSKNQPVENLDLVKQYYDLRQDYHVDLVKVPGHAGVFYNELADKLATGKISVREVMQRYGH